MKKKSKMDKQKLIIVILIVAVLLSVVAIVVSLSISDFKVVLVQGPQKYGGNPTGGVKIGILPYQGAEAGP